MPVNDPTVCSFYGCGDAEAPHLVLWKCPAGHRDEYWYCGACIGEMTDLARRILAGGWTGTQLCSTCLARRLPVMEGIGWPLTSSGSSG